MRFPLMGCLCSRLLKYYLCGEPLERVESITDLGVIFSSDFSFSNHIDFLVNKVFRTVGFIKRVSSKFKASTVLYLFHSLVLPILTFCSVVWSPYTQCGLAKLESSLYHLMRFLSSKLGSLMTVYDHDYSLISANLGIYMIQSTHRYSNLVCAF